MIETRYSDDGIGGLPWRRGTLVYGQGPPVWKG